MTALEQAHAKLLYWAKYMIAEEIRWADYDPSDDDPAEAPPAWYAEIAASVEAVEAEGGEAIE